MLRLSLHRCVVALLFGLAACTDDAGRPTLLPERPPPSTLGLYEVTITGIGTDEMSSSIAPVDGSASGSGPLRTLNTVGSGVAVEFVSSGSIIEGTRGAGGQRYLTSNFRLRNSTGQSLTNLTMLLVARPNTIAGTPFSALVRFDGTAADPSIASTIAPTGAVAMYGGTAGLRALYPDVLQVFTEAEVAAITPPAGVLDIFPVGFMARSVTAEATSRTLPPATSANQYDGMITFSFRVPMQASASADVFTMSFQVLAIQDTETRLTESIEEGQDTAAVRRLRERAASLGATTVTVLAGSPASGPEVADYPGQRQICSVRTAGTAGSPTSFITRPAAYARLALYRPGESLSACGADFRSGTATTPTLNTAYAITLRALDRYGNVISGTIDTVALSQATGPAATFGAPAPLSSGQATANVTYQAAGTSVLTALGRRNRGERTVEVPANRTMSPRAGAVQAAMAGTGVPTPPSVTVRDLGGTPVPGVPVTFAVTGGGGSVTGAVATTNASGVATVGSWILGSTADLNTLSATAPGVSGSVAFQASGCAGGGGAGYAPTLCYTSPLTSAQRAAVESSAARWGAVVTGDLPDFPVGAFAGAGRSWSPGFQLNVDDLVILVRSESIDGIGGSVGSAAPCISRSGGGLPIVGTLRFDAADLAQMEGSGLLENVVLHEMGHVLGIGTLWSALGLVVNPSPVGGPAADTYFSGIQGVNGFDLIGGNTYTGGQKVPVENNAPAGTINVHWRESVLANELMTGYVSVGPNPLSQATARSLVDMGYTVNTSAADSFFLTLAFRAAPEDLVPLVNDVTFGPLYRVDENGRTTRIR